MSKPEIIKIDDVEYVRKDTVKNEPPKGDVKIVILQRGWVMIGRFERNGTDCKLHNASVIRKWGTTNGLGELVNGALQETILDYCGEVEFDYLTVVAAITCEESKWQSIA